MYSRLESYIKNIESNFKNISQKRKNILIQLNNYLLHKYKNKQTANLIFICTENSRRSHFAQIWAATSISYYRLNDINSFSGGTKISELNKRAINVLRKAGFKITNPAGDKPVYKISFSKKINPLECFSKKYDSSFNPNEYFAAIMICSDAEKTCPYIPKAEARIFLPYNDPKIFDGTNLEEKYYKETCEKIAIEMLFVMKNIKKGQVYLKENSFK